MNDRIRGMVFAAIALGLGAAGCGNARTPDQYATDTRSVLATKNDAIKACYEAELRKDAKTKGTVVVQFTVEPDTGKIVGANVESAAMPSLGQCVTQALAGLALSPADSKQGIATFTWDFTPGPTPPPPAPPAPGKS